MKIQEQVSLNIRTARLERGLTQKELAQKAGFKVSFVARLETLPQNVSLAVLEKIGIALNKQVSELVEIQPVKKITKSNREVFLKAMRLMRAFESTL